MGDMREIREDPNVRIVRQSDVNMAEQLAEKVGEDALFWIRTTLIILGLEER